MGFFANPKAWIVVSGVVGFFIGGGTRLLVGLGIGVVLTFVVSGIVRAVQGGSIPRNVKRELVENLLRDHPEAVRGAFPSLSEEALSNAVKQEIERTIKVAVLVSPSHEKVFSEGVIRAALQKRLMEEGDPERQEMLRALRHTILRDWYAAGV